MSHYVLDTDILTLFEQGHPAITQRVLGQPASRLSITIITIEEQLTGWYTLVRRATRRDRLAMAYEQLAESVRLLANFSILSFSEPAILRYEQLRALKLNIGSMDLRIAAIVLEAGLVLVSRNLRDFGRVPGLTVEDWSTPMP